MSLGLYDISKAATETFRTFQEGRPDLVDIGIPAIQEAIGGFSAGTLCGYAMATGVGKSNLALSMLLTSRHRGGLISTEDPRDVMGARALSWASGVSATDIRRKYLSVADRGALRDALERLKFHERDPRFEEAIGANLSAIKEKVQKLADEGCRFVVLDYLQKVRGADPNDRRNEVGQVMTGFHAAAHEANVVPVLVSQLSRMERTKKPQINHLKESGDIENEMRLIVLGHIAKDDPRRVDLRVAKSTFGGVGLSFSYRYTDAGVLRYMDPAEEEEL